MAAEPPSTASWPDARATLTDGGVAGPHAALADDARLVAPATANELNTFAPLLFPIACWRMDDIRFDFDLSFIRPEAKREMKLLAALVQSHAGAPLSVFGHADPTGTDEYNKQLSGRRAAAVYGLLIRDTAIWEDLYKVPYGSDNWGLKSIQSALEAVGHPPGDIDGKDGNQTQCAVRAFQAEHRLPQTGEASKGTRAKLFEVYMDFLCGHDFRLKQTDFLARGTGVRGKGDYQGCGEFNAIVRASAEQAKEFKKPEKKSERDEFHSPNRRVTVFLFRPGSKVDPQRWPCPDAIAGPEKCRKRFWSDHELRCRAGQQVRRFEQTFDTFACRFYDRIAGESPCERPNALRAPLAAGRLPSVYSRRRTFPKPTALPLLREIAQRVAADPALRILILGHGDSVGSEGDNHQLSLARAEAVKAIITGDTDFLRQRFVAPDPLEVWGWEEVQWMLSALKVSDNNFYAGMADGHRGDATHNAVEMFQVAHGLKISRRMDEETLKKLIEKYVELIGPGQPRTNQIETLGGGSWHPPRSFGPDSKLLEDAEVSEDRFFGFRRVEVFLSHRRFDPPSTQCPPERHAECAAYEKWCVETEEVLEQQRDFTFLVRLLDHDASPLEGVTINLFRQTPDGEEEDAGSFSSSEFGLIRLNQPSGNYHLSFEMEAFRSALLSFCTPISAGA